MKGWTIAFLLFGSLIFTACKSEFEKLRISNDTELVYKKSMKYYDNKDYYKAQVLFEQIIGRYRGKKEAEELYFRYAYTHYYLSNYILAASYFQNFANTYLTSPLREEAAYMSAYCNYLQSPDYKLDQTFTTKAIDELQTFLNSYPDSKRADKVNDLIDELRGKLENKAFHEATLYYDLKQYQAAIVSLQNILKDYPDTKNIEQIRYLIVKANYELALRSIYAKKLNRFGQAQSAAELFKSKFPTSSYRKEVNSILKKVKDNIKLLEDGHKSTITGN
jgi:outer membrane protein assembly factor BamD